MGGELLWEASVEGGYWGVGGFLGGCEGAWVIVTGLDGGGLVKSFGIGFAFLFLL